MVDGVIDVQPCSQLACSNGSPIHTFAPAGTLCVGGWVCDGSGHCIGCMDDSMCPAGAQCTGRECKGQLGFACSDGMICASGLCADGVCCESACDGVCVSCNVDPSTSGTCNSLPASQQDPGTCDGLNACDGGGTCKLATGAPCGGDGDCASGKCAEHVCV
jgi:hypothetical protein